MHRPPERQNPRAGGPEGSAKYSAGRANDFHHIAALGTYTANRERVLGRGSRLWLANKLLDHHSDDINAAIRDLYEAAALRRGAA